MSAKSGMKMAVSEEERALRARSSFCFQVVNSKSNLNAQKRRFELFMQQKRDKVMCKNCKSQGQFDKAAFSSIVSLLHCT